MNKYLASNILVKGKQQIRVNIQNNSINNVKIKACMSLHIGDIFSRSGASSNIEQHKQLELKLQDVFPHDDCVPVRVKLRRTSCGFEQKKETLIRMKCWY